MSSEINYLPIDVQENKAVVVGPELREENLEKFLMFEEQFKEGLIEINSRYAKFPLALSSLTKGINFNNLTGCNALFANCLASFSGKKLINFSELEGILRKQKDFFSYFYTDLSEIVLISDKTSYEKNKYVLEHLVEQVQYCCYEINPERPLIIPSPKIVFDSKNFDKGYGILLELGKDPYYDSDLIANREIILHEGIENTLCLAKEGINRISFMKNEFTVGPDLTESLPTGRMVFIERE